MFEWVNKIMQFAGLETIQYFKRSFFSRNSLALVMQFAGLALTFGCNILLARFYGDQNYGVFSLVSGWAVLFSIVGLFGMDDRHLARVPALNLKENKTAIKHELFSSLKINLVSASLSVFLFYILIRFSGIPVFSRQYHFFLYALLLIPCYVFMNNLLYFLRSMKGIIQGEIADKLVRPASFAIIALGFCYFLSPGTPAKVLAANITGLIVVIILLAFFVRSSLFKIKDSTKDENLEFVPASNYRYTLINLLYFLSIRLDILVLGLFVSSSDVGHYTIASRFGDIFSYPVAMLNLSFPVMLSEKIHHQNLEQASLLPYKMARNAFCLCLFTGIIFIFFAPWIFSMFGKKFSEATSVLPIFLIATLVNASAGLSDVFFIVTGNEKKVIICRVISVLATAVCALTFVPRFGMNGAAWSMLAGSVLYYVSIQFYYWKAYHHFINPFFGPRIP
jgi:O-antigen/teichoic acid export membrane protein